LADTGMQRAIAMARAIRFIRFPGFVCQHSTLF
jgi:hypothetical protein